MVVINWNVGVQVTRYTMCQLKVYVYNDLAIDCQNNSS